nr:hypothetical protein [Neorhizobium tomejilense]
MEADIPDFTATEIEEVARMHGRDHRQETSILGHEGQIYTELAPKGLVDDGYALTHRLQLPRDGQRLDEYVWSPLAVRYHDALLQLRFDNGSGVDAKVFPQGAIDVVAGRHDKSLIGTREDYRFNALDEDPFHEAREIMSAAAADLVMVDGAIWRRSHLPVIAQVPQAGSLPTRRIMASTHISTIHVPLSEVGRFGYGFEFSVVTGGLDREEGYQLAEDITRQLGGTDIRQAHPEVAIHVYDHSYFTDQDATPVWLLHCAHKIRDNLCHRLLQARGSYDNETAAVRRVAMNARNFSPEALLLLHSLTREIPETDVTGDYTRLASLVRQAAATPEATSFGKSPLMEQLVMNAAVDQWENRPIVAPALGSPFATP